MGGLIFLFLVAVLIVILVTPAIRARLNKDAPPTGGSPTDESPHEVVVRRLDDHRSRRNRPTDDSIPRE